MQVTYVHLPAIPGEPTVHTGERQTRSAAREIRNAERAGKGAGAYMRSVTLL